MHDMNACAGPPEASLLMHSGLPDGVDVHALFAGCSEYQQNKLSQAKCNPEPAKGPRPSAKAVARGIDAISKLMEPGQQTLQTNLDSCFSKQMLDRKDCPQRFMIAVRLCSAIQPPFLPAPCAPCASVCVQ